MPTKRGLKKRTKFIKRMTTTLREHYEQPILNHFDALKQQKSFWDDVLIKVSKSKAKTPTSRT